MEISTESSGLANTRKHVVRGAVDLEELKAFLADVYTTMNGSTSMDVLWDLRDVDFSSITDDLARSVSEFISGHWGKEGGRRAALIVSSDLSFVTSKTYESILAGATSSSVAVFRRMHEAEKWIQSAAGDGNPRS
jgi:hypothetical protein